MATGEDALAAGTKRPEQGQKILMSLIDRAPEGPQVALLRALTDPKSSMNDVLAVVYAHYTPKSSLGGLEGFKIFHI
jgi:hypothetical protein